MKTFSEISINHNVKMYLNLNVWIYKYITLNLKLESLQPL